MLDKRFPRKISTWAHIAHDRPATRPDHLVQWHCCECLYQRGTNCPELTGHLDHWSVLLHPARHFSPGLGEVLNLSSAGGWDRQRGEKGRNTPRRAAFVRRRYGDSGPKGSHSPTLGWGENDNESKNCVCVCVSVCMELLSIATHTRRRQQSVPRRKRLGVGRPSGELAGASVW